MVASDFVNGYQGNLIGKILEWYEVKS
jgi:hypothetical protein